MSADGRRKLFIVILLLLVCGGLFAFRARLRRPAPRPPEAPRVDPATIASTALDRAAVEQLLPHLEGATWVRYDPLAVVRVVPDHSETIGWPEHAGGRLSLRTNNLGFREDSPTPPGPPRGDDLRVLVLGDSHTFGLVANEESFANVLERRLAPQLAPRRCEVLNAGASGSGPFEERALLGVLLDLQPQLVLCVLYTGNDFINAQAFADFEARRARVPMPRDAQQRFAKARELEKGRMAQNTSQLHSFLHRKGDVEVALQATIQCYLEMAQYCAERGARFLVAVLPPKEDVDESDLATLAPIREMLLLCDDDFALNRRLAARFSDALRVAGIEVVDLLPALAGFRRPLYWESDYHLAVDGHAVVASALQGPVLAALRSLPPSR